MREKDNDKQSQEKREETIAQTANNIQTMQLSALSRINFCFDDLKKHPPLAIELQSGADTTIDIFRDHYSNLDGFHQMLFKNELRHYLHGESITEAKTMLIINYLAALLIKGRNNNISIHKNFAEKAEEIHSFEEENKQILNKIQTARDKLYAHIDLDWASYAKGITFDELDVCVQFLNKLFDYRFDVIKSF